MMGRSTGSGDSARRFLHRVVYIPGGSSGIGLEIARQLAGQGAHLVLFARDEHRLAAACGEVTARRRFDHQRVFSYPMDVCDARQVPAVMDRAMGEAGTPDILVHCAGIVRAGRFDQLSADAFDAVMQTNMYGARHVAAALAPAMRPAGGHLVFVSSAAGLLGMYGYTAYAASKYALVGFCESLRAEMRPHGIRVSVVCPPEVITPMLDQEKRTLPPEARAVKHMAGVLTPDTVARATIRGIQKGRFMIVPGFLARTAYWLHRISNGCLTRYSADQIIGWHLRRRAGSRASGREDPRD